MERVFAVLLALFATQFHSALHAGVPAGYGLVWSDEFNGADNSAPSAANWNYDTGCGGFGNNEWQNYTTSTNNSFITSDGAAVDGKTLVLKAFNTGGGGCGYTSARIQSAGKRTFQYGYIEARLKLPYGQGIWPAFWMLGTDIGPVGWPACGEIDVMENIGRASEQGRCYGTIHGPGYSGAGGITAAYNLPAGQYFKDAYHTFAIRWEANLIEFSIDGNLYATRTPASIPGGTTWAYNHPFFFILNLAVGGNWPGYPDGSTTFPQEFRVDYVRVYQQGVGPTPTFTPTLVPHPVPGRIQAEDYHNHADNTAGNQGGALRNDNVDIEASTDAGGGFNVGWTEAGEWLEYRINVASAGLYNLVLRVASGNGGPTSLTPLLDGGALGGMIAIGDTGGWQTWTDVSANNLSLPAGIHTLRFNLGGGFNLNYFDLNAVPTPTPTPTATLTPHPVPGRIQAENYHNHFDTTAGNTGGALRNDNVDIEATTDAGGGYNIAWNDAGDWLEYRINVSGAGPYMLTLRVASAAAGPFAMNLSLDGGALGGPIPINATGGWQTWADLASGPFTLPAGIHLLRLNLGGGYNLNYFDLTAVPPTATPSRTSTGTRTRTASPTRTATADDTDTATPTPSRTASPSLTRTLTSTPSLTASASRTPSSTLSATPSPTFSASFSRTASPMASPSQSPLPSATLSATPSRASTPLASPSQSATSSVVPSLTPSPPAIPSATQTASPAPSVSASASPSPASSPTASPTATRSLTQAPSPSATPTRTPTLSLTHSATPAASGTATPAPPSNTPTASATPSRSPSPTSTGTRSATPAASLTSTPQPPSPSRTATRSPFSTATQSPTPAPPTATPQSPGGAPVIEQVLPAPNPNPLVLYVRLSGHADRIETRIYTAGMTLVRSFETGPHYPGWTLVILPQDFAYGAPNGTYHYRMTASKGGAASAPHFGSFYIAR